MQAFLHFRGFDFHYFWFTAVYDSILFSSPVVLLSNLDLHSFCFHFFLCPHINRINRGMPVYVENFFRLLRPLFLVEFWPSSLLLYCGQSPFYLPWKKLIFVRLQIFLHASCNFLHPEELSPMQKNYERGYWCLQIWLRILHNWHFLKYFVQIPKKIYMQPAQKKLHPGKNFIHPAKI